MLSELRAINEMVRGESAFIERLLSEVSKVIVGQKGMVERILIGLLSDGHVLLIYNPHTGAFSAKQGPIFANLVLADEINRAPAKVQSALLEGMQERQVTIGDTTYPLPSPFFVMATQNPIEQEGTYPLPEALLDRFMQMVKVTYPTHEQ
jgi:MoxR-like ATPase